MKHNTDALIKKWKAVLDSDMMSKYPPRRDDILAVFLEEQSLFTKSIGENNYREAFSSLILPVAGRAISKLLVNGTLNDIQAGKVEYEKVTLPYDMQLFNDLRCVMGTDHITCLMEAIHYEVEETYFKLSKSGSLILPIAPLVTFNDFDLYGDYNPQDKIVINLLKPLEEKLDIKETLTTEEFIDLVIGEPVAEPITKEDFFDCIVSNTRTGNGKLHPVYSRKLLKAKILELTGEPNLPFVFRFTVD
jgi:hypothetical protein